MSFVVLGGTLSWQRAVTLVVFLCTLLVLKFAIVAKGCNASVVLLLWCDVETTTKYTRTPTHTLTTCTFVWAMLSSKTMQFFVGRNQVLKNLCGKSMCSLLVLLILSFTPLPSGNRRGQILVGFKPIFVSASLAMAMPQTVWIDLLTFIACWCVEGSEDDQQSHYMLVESTREALRSILVVCGLHRATYVVGEAWQVFTGIMNQGIDCPLHSPPVPIESATPYHAYRDLECLGDLAHASILEEELSAAKSRLKELHDRAVVQEESELIIEWLSDLRFVVAAARFAVLHRSA